MDIGTVTSAYQGLKAVKEILGVVFDAKVDAEATPKILDAMDKLGKAQDTLFELREELFKLQEINNSLKDELTAAKGWQEKMEKYVLIQTHGGAVVFEFKGEPKHYVCPSCVNGKEIHILQDNRTMSGKYRCTGCESEFPILPQKRSPPSTPSGGSWMS